MVALRSSPSIIWSEYYVNVFPKYFISFIDLNKTTLLTLTWTSRAPIRTGTWVNVGINTHSLSKEFNFLSSPLTEKCIDNEICKNEITKCPRILIVIGVNHDFCQVHKFLMQVVIIHVSHEIIIEKFWRSCKGHLWHLQRYCVSQQSKQILGYNLLGKSLL